MAKVERSIRLIGRTAGDLDSISGAPGEIFLDSSNQTLRVYDGNTLGGSNLGGSGSGLNTEQVQDITADLFNTAHNGVTVSYNDGAASLTLTVANQTWSQITGKPTFATVATTGSYTDLINQPTIPTNTNQLANGAGYITATGIASQTGNSGKYLTTDGSATSWGTITVTAASVGLGNVTNESKSTMFTSPTFTGNSSVTGSLNVGQTILTSRFLSSPYQPVVPRSPVYRGTGALTQITTAIAAGTAPMGVAVDPSSRFVYVVNSTGNFVNGTVSQYSINQTTGALTSITTAIATGTSPRGVAADPTGRFVYVTNHGTSGNSVSQYSINQTTGALTSIATIGSGNRPFGIAVDPTGRFVYTANYTGNTVSQYSINQTTGALTQITTAIATGTSPQGIAVEPTGRFAYTANSGDSTVSQYSINQTTGSLTQITTAIASGSFPNAVAVDPTGRFVYTANGGDNTVSQYSINQTTGALTQITTAIASSGYPIKITADPTGRFVYVTNYSGSTVSQYSINQTTGALTQITTAIATGTSPYEIAVDSTGRFVYVVNESSANVSQYSINNFSAGSGVIAGALTVGGTLGVTGTLAVTGSTSGSITLQAGATPAAQTYTLPAAYPASNGYALTSTTAGVLTWTSVVSSLAGLTGVTITSPSAGQVLKYNGSLWINDVDATSGGAGVGTVTTVSITSANGFTGTVATASSTPAITITTSITGVLKGNGTAISAAVSGVDYAPGTSALATGIVKSTTTTGALTIAVSGTDYQLPIGTISGLVKGNGANALTAAVAGTDYQTAQSVTGIVKSSGTTRSVAISGTDYAPGTSALATGIVKSTTTTGALTIAVSGTDYQAPIGTISGIVKGNGANALIAATAGTDYQAPLPTQTGQTGKYLTTDGTTLSWSTVSGGAGGTVTTVSVVSANGFTGTVATATSTPAITVTTSITGVLKGNGTAISAAVAGTDYQSAQSVTGIVKSSGTTRSAAVAGTDYQVPITFTTTGSSGAATFNGTALNIPQYTSGATAFSALTDATSAGLTVDEIYLSAITRLVVTTPVFNYNIDQYSGDNPAIYVISGTTIAFNLQVGGSHPFLLQQNNSNITTANLIHVSTSGAVSTGSAAQGQVTGTLYWKIPASVSGTFRYICQNHSSMVGTITINPATVTGTGNMVLSNSPTLVTPALGSPSSVGTMPAFTLGGTVSGGGNQINNVVIGTLSPLAGSFTTVGASGNLTSLTAQFGTNPAGVSIGVIGIPNQKRIYGRNAANTADVNILYVDASNNVVFGPSDMASFSSTGLAVTGTLSATGITFPATQSASSDVNTLDDYEEGTWTPTLQTDGNTSFTVTTALGKYTKIGNLVNFTMYFVWSAQSGSYGSVTVTGYPFTIYWGASSVQRMFSFPVKASSAAIQGFQLKNDTNNYVNNSYLYNSTDTSIVSAASIGGSGWFSVQGQYWTT